MKETNSVHVNIHYMEEVAEKWHYFREDCHIVDLDTSPAELAWIMKRARYALRTKKASVYLVHMTDSGRINRHGFNELDKHYLAHITQNNKGIWKISEWSETDESYTRNTAYLDIKEVLAAIENTIELIIWK